MKILNAINCANPAGGGPIESILQAHTALKHLGHDSEIVCLDAPLSPWLATLPITTHPVGPAHSKYRYTSRYIPWLRAHASQYDCVLVHGIWLFPSSGAWRALRGSPTPYFIYTHGMLDPAFRSLFPWKHLQKQVVWRLVERRVVQDARALFFTCEEEKRLAEKSFSPATYRSAIVPYCIGNPPGEPGVQRNLFFETYPRLRGKRLILFLSRLHPKKGCDILLKAFATIAQDRPDLHLVMAGPDSIGWRGDLERMAQHLGVAEHVTWTGMLAGDLKWGAFRASDLFVLPSHQENFGIAVVEALACGVPVMISRRINIWREIEADGAGFIGEPDTASFAGLLQQWLSTDRETTHRHHDHARRCFEQRFQSSKAVANLLTVLKGLGVSGP
ncbi:MAG TPA: glycosyltransferase [Kiritimatiellia bacterium]|nr:glycosyltransferase [Kiritimatiellia bacterium]